MICKFCPVGNLILIFLMRILQPPELFELSQVKSLLKQMLFHSLYEVSIAFGGTLFS